MSAQRHSALERIQAAISTVQQILAYAKKDILDAVGTDAVDLESNCKKLLESFTKAETNFKNASQEFQHLILSEQELLGSESLTQESAGEQLGAVKALKRVRPAAQVLVNCPYEAIIFEYTEALPELPSVRVVDDVRKKAIAKRWDWVLKSHRPDGTRRAETPEQAIDWFRKYFQLARENDFVMGRTKRAPEHQNWKCDIEFLMSSKGLKHVIEKTDAQ